MDSVTAPAGTKPERSTATAQNARLAEVEVLRAIAILLVMVQHVPVDLIFWPTHRIGSLLLAGGFWTGVDLFFAISGFVIARALLPQLAGVTGWVGFTRVSVTFWIARAWRLMPSAWLWLTLPLILCLAFNRSGVYGSFAENWAVFIAGVLDLQNFHLAETFNHASSGTAFVQWSLSLEEQFYLLLPFAAFFFRRYLAVPLFIVALAGFFVPASVAVLMVRLWPVAFGVLLALWTAHESYRNCAPSGLAKSRATRMGLLAILLLCLVGVGTPSLRIVSFYQGPVALISAILVWIASYDRGYLWQDGFARRVLAAIAARSYCLYLVHIPVYFAAHEIWFRLYGMAAPSRYQAVVLLGLAGLAVFGTAELNHRLLEQPLRNHGKRMAAQYRARPLPQPVLAL